MARPWVDRRLVGKPGVRGDGDNVSGRDIGGELRRVLERALGTGLTRADLLPIQGQPAAAPWRLALVTVLQFMEGLTDRQAADAVRTRIDWKYLLCLELTDPGFDHTVLSEFRTRLLADGAERCFFDAILTSATEHSWVKAGGRQRSDSTHVLGAMHVLSRMEVADETLRHALNVFATLAPAWPRPFSNT